HCQRGELGVVEAVRPDRAGEQAGGQRRFFVLCVACRHHLGGVALFVKQHHRDLAPADGAHAARDDEKPVSQGAGLLQGGGNQVKLLETVAVGGSGGGLILNGLVQPRVLHLDGSLAGKQREQVAVLLVEGCAGHGAGEQHHPAAVKRQRQRDERARTEGAGKPGGSAACLAARCVDHRLLLLQHSVKRLALGEQGGAVETGGQVARGGGQPQPALDAVVRQHDQALVDV